MSCDMCQDVHCEINWRRWSENNDVLGTNLIGQAVQRTSQTIHGSAEGQVGVRQGATHQVAGVGTDVASFVITVTSQKK